MDNLVEISTATITVRQTQTFKGAFGQTVWEMIDTDKNGKVTATEKKAFEPQAKTFFTDHSGIRVNWAMAVPDELAVNLGSVPSKKPDLAKAGFGFTLTATFNFVPSPLDLVELIIPNVNAHQIKVAFQFRGPFRPLRSNSGVIDDTGVKEMIQTDGHPDSFSVIIHKP